MTIFAKLQNNLLQTLDNQIKRYKLFSINNAHKRKAREANMFSFYRTCNGQWAARYTFKTRKEAQAKLAWIYENTDWLLNGYVVKKIDA